MNDIIVPDWPITQKKYEIVMIQEFLKNEKISTVLEIGTSRGGTATLWAMMVAPNNGRVFCCDVRFDWGSFIDGNVVYNRQVYDNFNAGKYITEFPGDSHDPRFIEAVKKEVGEVDLLFLDGDHSYEGVKQDFYNFYSTVKMGGHILFHDITDTEFHRSEGVDVARFWQELKKTFDCYEFIDNNKYRWVDAHLCMGIGIIKKTRMEI